MEAANDSWTSFSYGSLLIPFDLLELLIGILRVPVIVTAIFGFLSNLVNIVVFLKMGLSTTTNLCFFTLAISDMVFVSWILGQYVSPFVDDTAWAMSWEALIVTLLSQVAYASSAFGSWVTTIINMERCCSIVFPMMVKRVFTKKTVVILLLSMVVYEGAMLVPYYISSPFGTTTSPETNRTQIVADRVNQDRDLSTTVRLVAFSIPTAMCFVLVIIGTVFLIRSFRKSIQFRKTMAAGNRSAETTAKDDRVIKSVIFICTIYITGYSVNVVKFIVSAFPGVNLHMGDPVMGTFTILLTTVAFFCQVVACSINIFVYLRMSSSYKRTFASIFYCDNKAETKADEQKI